MNSIWRKISIREPHKLFQKCLLTKWRMYVKCFVYMAMSSADDYTGTVIHCFQCSRCHKLYIHIDISLFPPYRTSVAQRLTFSKSKNYIRLFTLPSYCHVNKIMLFISPQIVHIPRLSWSVRDVTLKFEYAKKYFHLFVKWAHWQKTKTVSRDNDLLKVLQL